MHILGIFALVLGLAALLIMGYLNVVQALLSRSIFEAPSYADDARSGETSAGAPRGHGVKQDLISDECSGERSDDSPMPRRPFAAPDAL
jgi:hypothetical protein